MSREMAIVIFSFAPENPVFLQCFPRLRGYYPQRRRPAAKSTSLPLVSNSSNMQDPVCQPSTRGVFDVSLTASEQSGWSRKDSSFPGFDINPAQQNPR